MKKLLILPIILLLITACSSKPDAYFDFDTVTYYHTDITHEELYNLEKISTNKKDFELFSAIIWGYYGYPRTTRNVHFIKGVEKNYPVKVEFKNHEIAQFNEMFKQKEVKRDTVATLCEAFYRDILVFKKSEKVTGIVKLCFECQQFETIGTKDNVAGFGGNSDWEKLTVLLSKKLPRESSLINE